jgi:hypothetical protein
MDEGGFRIFLEERKAKKEEIEASIKDLRRFDDFLKKKGSTVDRASSEEFYEYSAHLIGHEKNIYETYSSILRYALFTDNKDLYVATMEVFDGEEVMRNLSKRLTDEFGEEFRNEIFEGISLPPLGIRPQKKPAYTKKLISRLEKKLGTARCTEFLAQGLRDRYEEWRRPDRKKFLQSKNIDAFLENKRRGYIEELEQHCKNGTLYFTQRITKEVLEFIKNDPAIEVGIREGDTIITKKIPHMAKEYLEEEDEQKKRYYYCHCPWVKEALADSSRPISPAFCNCSAGYYKAYWEIVLDQPVNVEVLGSILNGDPVCTFAVHLPKDIVDAGE